MKSLTALLILALAPVAWAQSSSNISPAAVAAEPEPEAEVTALPDAGPEASATIEEPSQVSMDTEPVFKEGPSHVQLLPTEEGYQLYMNGKPFWIMGAGGQTQLKELKAAGGNTVRMWGSDGAGPVMNAAYSNGLAVCLGLWMKHERHGMKYDNRDMVDAQLLKLREAVKQYKKHPALLMWGAGNEVEWQPGTNVLVYKAINEVAKMIKSEDTNHPVMCTLADLGVNNFKVDMIRKYCPDIDVLGVNSYGGLRTLGDRLRNAGWTKPYIVTEYGPKGTWEMPRLPWGAPTEQTTTDKAKFAYDGYKSGIQANTNWCLGGFVFRWGFKFEVTPTWFSIFNTDNTHYSMFDGMTYLWTGQWPSNRCPEIITLDSQIGRKKTPLAETYFATISAADPDNDPLTFKWVLVRETNKRNKEGGWDTQEYAVPKGIISTNGTRVTFRAAAGAGGYRLFVYVHDGHGGAASANLPFYVLSPEEAAAIASQQHATNKPSAPAPAPAPAPVAK